jgi:AraC-like DNA-binding protein
MTAPLNYVSMVRIQAACRALAATGSSISRFSSENGFYDLSPPNVLPEIGSASPCR